MSDKTPGDNAEEPCIWVHYDKVVGAISIAQSRPVDDDDEENINEDINEGDEIRSIVEDPAEREICMGAADDAF